jgi:hypothetical protein
LHSGLALNRANAARRLDVTLANNHTTAALNRLPVLIHQLLALQQDFDLARALGNEIVAPRKQIS